MSVHLPERKKTICKSITTQFNYKLYILCKELSMPIIKYFGEMFHERTKHFLSCFRGKQAIPESPDHSLYATISVLCPCVLGPLLHSALYFWKTKTKIMHPHCFSCSELPFKGNQQLLLTPYGNRGIQFSPGCAGVGQQGQDQEEPLQGKCVSQPCGSHHAFTVHPPLSDALGGSFHGVVKLCYLPYNYCTKGASKSY